MLLFDKDKNFEVKKTQSEGSNFQTYMQLIPVPYGVNKKSSIKIAHDTNLKLNKGKNKLIRLFRSPISRNSIILLLFFHIPIIVGRDSH